MRYSGCDCLDIATHRALLASNCPSITLAMNVAVGLGMLSSTILSTHMIGMESTAPVMPPVRTIVAAMLTGRPGVGNRCPAYDVPAVDDVLAGRKPRGRAEARRVVPPLARFRVAKPV